MKPVSSNFWRYLVYLWPIILVYWLGQNTMRLSGNTAALGIGAVISAFDFVMLVVCFSAAAWWTYMPLDRCLAKFERPEEHRNVIEKIISDFPWRALRAYLVTGLAYAVYLSLIISITALQGDHEFSWRIFISLSLNIFFGAMVLAPALAVAASIIYSSRLRLKLSAKGLFVSQLDGAHSYRHITSASHRPWLIFVVTSLLPTLILSMYVYLALNGSETEQRFIMSQALVLLVMSISASVILVWSMSHTLKRVTGALASGLEQLASGEFGKRVPILLDDDLGDLARGLNTAMEGLQERDDLKDSLAVAAEIQQGLLPRFAPVIPNYHLVGFQQTCYAVGGDYYDYIKLEDGRIWLMIADASGKGYPAALTMANLQAMLRGLAAINWPIEEAASYLNDTLCDTLTAGHFVTLFMGKLQPESHSLVWVNAGHVPPLMITADGVEKLAATAPPLGMVKGTAYEVQRTEFAAGDLLFAYTDGVTESTERSGKMMFGEERLKKWLSTNHAKPIDTLPSALIQELNDFGRDSHGDDLTLLCARREG